MHAINSFDWGARNFPDRLAFSGAGGEVSYAEAQRITNQIARALLADGARSSGRFAVLSPNCSSAMLAILGGLRAGGAWCNLNLRAALEAQLRQNQLGHHGLDKEHQGGAGEHGEREQSRRRRVASLRWAHGHNPDVLRPESS